MDATCAALTGSFHRLSLEVMWVSKLILFGEASLRRALREYLVHYHQERNHQGRGNILLFPSTTMRAAPVDEPSVRCRERLGGLLKYYHREAA